MAKKLLALVSALALLVCAVSVFTVVSVSADAALDEFVAAERKNHAPVASDFQGLSSYWNSGMFDAGPYGSKTEDLADGGVRVSLKPCGTERHGEAYTKELALNGAHIVVDGLSAIAAAGGNFALHLSGSVCTQPDACTVSTVAQFKFDDGNMTTWPGAGGDVLIEGSDVVKAMANGPSVISFAVVDGAVSITITNAAGSVTSAPLVNYGSGWTDHSKAYVAFGTNSWDKQNQNFSIDVLAIHGGDAKCGAVIAAEEKEAARIEALNALIAADNEHNAPAASNFQGLSGYWNSGMFDAGPYGSKTEDLADGGVRVSLKPCGTERHGEAYKKELALNGAHIVVDGLSAIAAAGGNFALHLGGSVCKTEDACAVSTVAQFKFDDGTMTTWPGAGGDVLINDSDVVKAMANGPSVISFAVVDGAVAVTIENAAGKVTSAPLVNYGSGWTDHSKAYVAFGTNCWDKQNQNFSIDVLAIHGGDETCGVDVEDKPETEEPPVTEPPVVTEPPYVAPECSQDAPTTDLVKDPGWWPAVLSVTATDLGVKVSFTNSTSLDMRTYGGSKAFALDGLHISLRNVTGDGVGFWLSNTADGECGSANGMRFQTKPSGKSYMYSPIWVDGVVDHEAQLGAYTTDIDIYFTVNDDGSVNYTLNGVTSVIPAEKVAESLADTANVYVQFAANPWAKEAVSTFSCDVVSLHSGSCEKPAGPTEDELAAKAVDDMVANLGEITLESGDAIQAAYDAYAALTDAQKLLVAADTLTKWQAAKDAYDALVEESQKPETPEKVTNAITNNPTSLDAWHPNSSYWGANGRISLTTVNGGVNVATNPHPHLCVGAQTNAQYYVDGALMVIGNFAGNAPVLTITMGNNEGDTASNGWGSTDTIINLVLAEGKALTYPGGGGDVIIENSDVIKAIATEATLIEFALVDGNVALTFTNSAGSATGTLVNYGSAWTDKTQAYFGIANHSCQDGQTSSIDILAFKGGVAPAGPSEEDKAAAKAVDDMVNALGEITLESGAAIQAAYDAYAALTDAQKALVAADTLTKWQAAKDAYDALVESQPGTQPSTEPSTEPPVVGPTLNTTEIIAGDTKYYKASAADFNGNDSYHNGGRIKWSDGDNGVHCILDAANTARLGYNYLEELTLNGTHIVIANMTVADEFCFIIGKDPSTGAGDHPARSLLHLVYDGAVVMNHPDGSELATGSAAVTAFFEGKATLFAFAVAEDGTVSATIANEAGETTVTFTAYGEQWTDHTKAYIAIATNSANGPREFDIVSVHGGDVECGETVNPDEAAVKEVEALIDAIGTVTLESANAINAAMEAYEALEDAQKAVVSNYDKLMAAALEFTELYFNQYRYEYNIGIRVNSGEITPHYCSFLNAEQFDENRGVLIDQWAPDKSGWAERTGYNFAVPLDGLQIVLKDLSSVKESGNIISIGLMNEAGAWVDAESMIAFLFMPTPREGGGEYGYLHVESKKNGLAYSACLDQVDFESNIWAADLDQVVIEFAYDPVTSYVGVYVNGQFMTVVTMEDLGIADVNAVIPHFGLWGTGVCNYGVYSITSKAQADRVQAAIDAIEGLGDIDPSNADDVAKVEAAEEAYKGLDKNLRGYVTNYDKLLEAIEKVEGVEPDEPTEDPVETEEPTEAPVETDEPTEEPENPKTGEGFAVLPIALLIAAAGALVISRKRK